MKIAKTAWTVPAGMRSCIVKDIKTKNGTHVFLTKLLQDRWTMDILTDNDLLSVNTPAYGRFTDIKPSKTLLDLVSAAGEGLMGKIAVNGNNLYWHSQDFVVINGQLITRRNSVIDSCENLCLVQNMDGAIDIKSLSIANNMLNNTGILHALFGLRLVEDGKPSFFDHLEQFRFDMRKIFAMPKLANWVRTCIPMEVPRELNENNFDLALAKTAFLGQEVILNFDKAGTPEDLKYGLNNAGYHDFRQSGLTVKIKLAKNAGPANAAGITKNKELLLITANGRLPGQPGISLDELSRIFIEHGAESAVCFDGGGDTTLFINNMLVNTPSNTGAKIGPIPSAILFYQQ